MKKKVLALVMTLAMLASLLTVPAAAATGKTFPDAKGHWAEESILRWSRSGLVKGDERGNVNPDKALRRCEMATILSDMLGLRTAAPISTFKDIDGSEWYARAILRCAAAGIMEGSNSMSYPEDHITREEAITMFCRALGVQPSQAPDLSDFTDGDRVSGWAAPYMSTLTELGILSGMGDGSVAPHADINRAGAFTLMDKAISVYANAPGVYAAQNPKGFVVVNANSTQSGDVTITGKANGVMVTVGETNTVCFRDLTAENIVVNGKGDVTVTGKSAVDALAVNTAVAVNVEKDASVDTLDVKVEKVAVTNAGTVKTLNCTKAGSVTNSGKVTELVAGAAVSITNTGTVDKLVANAAITVNNTKGTVKDAEINMGGVVMDGPPQQMTVATGVARPSNSSGRPVTATGAASSGGGGNRPSSDSSTTVAVTDVTLFPSSWALKVGESVELEATVKPESATNKTLTWASSEPTVATVGTNGKVTAVGVGRTTITVSSNSDNKIKDTCEIVVYPAGTEIIPLDSVKFDAGAEGIIIEEGQKAGLYLIIAPLNADVESIEYRSDDPNIATVTKDDEVDNWAEVTGVSPGEATITAKVTVPVAGEGGGMSSGGASRPSSGGNGSNAVPSDKNTEVVTLEDSQEEGETETPTTTEVPKPESFEITCKVTVKAKPATSVPVESVSLNKSELTLEEGKSETLTATVTPGDATNQAVTWESGDPTVATVENGTVRAVKAGNTTITVTTVDGGETATCAVTVNEKSSETVAVTGVSLSQTELTLEEGKSETLTATVTPGDATNQAVTWESGDPTVATVTNGTVAAVGEGTATITVTTVDGGKTATCEVTVTAKGEDPEPPKPTISVKIEPASLDMTVGDEEKLTVIVSPDDTVERSITWENNSSAVEVDDDGTVTAVATGGTSLGVKVTIDGEVYTAFCQITVKSSGTVEPDIVPVTGITLDQDTLTLEEGETEMLTATVDPDDATDKTVTWTSDNDDVATVDQTGRVTAVAAGSATITATAGGQTAECTVTVPGKTPVTVAVTGVNLNQTMLEAKVGDTLEKLVAMIEPENASNQNVTWESSNTDVVIVEDGEVTIVGIGEATITVTTEDGNKTAFCTVTVSPANTEEGGGGSEETDPPGGDDENPTTPPEGTGTDEGEGGDTGDTNVE